MSDRIAEIRKATEGLFNEESDHYERVQIRIDVGSVLPIYIGRSFPAHSFSAVIRSVHSSDIPPNYKRPKIQGVSIRWISTTSRAGAPVDIVLELLHPEAIDVFVVFIARLCEIVEKCEDSKRALAAALGQIELWRHFFAGVASNALSESRQTGLFGELTMLRMLINDGMDVAAGITAWTGASATNQDFEIGRLAIEVKSTTSVDAMEIAISNVRQLDTTGVDCLYVARFAFDVRQGKDNTLVALITALRDCVLSEASHLRAVFEQKLIGAGYREKYADDYINRSYKLRDLIFYQVQEGFPRIDGSALPDGVHRVKYCVDLRHCVNFREDNRVAIDKVIKANG